MSQHALGAWLPCSKFAVVFFRFGYKTRIEANAKALEAKVKRKISPQGDPARCFGHNPVRSLLLPPPGGRSEHVES
ncbi:hypothetical protein, partial [Mycoplana sp. MJR14]|uniref:hypothetical protein n=1 Tax=Mycoplana sp. MJR14 TaxID=3032583 RepID=UPI0023DCB402